MVVTRARDDRVSLADDSVGYALGRNRLHLIGQLLRNYAVIIDGRRLVVVSWPTGLFPERLCVSSSDGSQTNATRNTRLYQRR